MSIFSRHRNHASGKRSGVRTKSSPSENLDNGDSSFLLSERAALPGGGVAEVLPSQINHSSAAPVETHK